MALFSVGVNMDTSVTARNCSASRFVLKPRFIVLRRSGVRYWTDSACPRPSRRPLSIPCSTLCTAIWICHAVFQIHGLRISPARLSGLQAGGFEAYFDPQNLPLRAGSTWIHGLFRSPRSDWFISIESHLWAKCGQARLHTPSRDNAPPRPRHSG